MEEIVLTNIIFWSFENLKKKIPSIKEYYKLNTLSNDLTGSLTWYHWWYGWESSSLPTHFYADTPNTELDLGGWVRGRVKGKLEEP